MSNSNQSLIIIGGGLSGLSTGIYGQMNGLRTQVFEMNSEVGGCCTSWERKGFTIDTCVHWIIGSREPSPFHKFWLEVGALQDKELVDHDYYVMGKIKDGRIFKLPNKLDALKKELLKFGPEDKKLINKFIKAIKKAQKMPMNVEKPMQLFSKWEFVKYLANMVPHALFFQRWTSTTLLKFASKFKSPILKEIFQDALYPAFGENPDMPMFSLLLTFAMMEQKTVCYTKKGSMGLTNSIKERYLSLGGKIHTGRKVSKILVHQNENGIGKAYGIQLEDGTEILGDFIISAADGYDTIYNMLGGNYKTKDLDNYYNSLPLTKPIIQIGFGISNFRFDLPSTVAGYVVPVQSEFEIAGEKIPWLLFQAYEFDNTLAPEGKTFVKAIIGSNYDYWAKIAETPVAYNQEKNKIAKKVIEIIDGHYSGFAESVEMIDIATPLTFEKWTGNRKGAYMGWRNSAKSIMIMMPNSLPGLSHFYMTGQWVKVGGGLPTAITAGRDIIQILCNELDRPFTTSKP
jgi:phytoene dehydrogenase-like protein